MFKLAATASLVSSLCFASEPSGVREYKQVPLHLFLKPERATLWEREGEFEVRTESNLVKPVGRKLAAVLTKVISRGEVNRFGWELLVRNVGYKDAIFPESFSAVPSLDGATVEDFLVSIEYKMWNPSDGSVIRLSTYESSLVELIETRSNEGDWIIELTDRLPKLVRNPLGYNWERASVNSPMTLLSEQLRVQADELPQNITSSLYPRFDTPVSSVSIVRLGHRHVHVSQYEWRDEILWSASSQLLPALNGRSHRPVFVYSSPTESVIRNPFGKDELQQVTVVASHSPLDLNLTSSLVFVANHEESGVGSLEPLLTFDVLGGEGPLERLSWLTENVRLATAQPPFKYETPAPTGSRFSRGVRRSLEVMGNVVVNCAEWILNRLP